MTDPIADMLTRVRNAQLARHDVLTLPASKLKRSVLELLKREGFIEDVTFEGDARQGVLHVALKYDRDGKGIILGLKRVSSPGCRRYSAVRDLPKVLGGLGVAILSTSKGVMTDRDARQHGVGGEVLAFVW
jgi:small subunit ribosomal protein S8